jgi:hypothetical protein
MLQETEFVPRRSSRNQAQPVQIIETEVKDESPVKVVQVT